MTDKRQAQGVDWIAVQGLYMAGQRPLRDIAEECGISEGSIRRHAKMHGWVRDASGTKRAIVSRAMAGVDATQAASQYALRSIEQAAAEDIADMERGLRIQRHCLMALEQSAEGVTEPREVKVIVEAAGVAIDSIRRIRGLSEEIQGKTGASTDDDDDARAIEIADRLVKRAARASSGGTAKAPEIGLGVAPVGER